MTRHGLIAMRTSRRSPYLRWWNSESRVMFWLQTVTVAFYWLAKLGTTRIAHSSLV